MKTRFYLTAALAGLVLAISPALRADTVVLGQNGFSYYNGGEFDTTTLPTTFLGNYSPLAMVGSAFETFCVEVNVDFNPGSTYYYTLGQTQVDPAGQKLSMGTAFLYYMFATGTLPNYDYLNTSGQRQTDAGQLQAAIWALQGGQVDPGDAFSGPPPLVGNFYYSYAYASLLNPTAPSNGAYGIDLLQLWQNPDDTGPAQDQLVRVTQSNLGAPDGGSTAMLLGGAFTAMSLLARRFRKSAA